MRVMVPEALGEELLIEEIPNGVSIQIAGRRAKFCYSDLGKAVDDPKQTMVKIALLKAYQKDYVWGGLMGVRPSKIVRRFLREGFSYEETAHHLEQFYLVKKEKAKLLVDIVRKEERFLHRGASNLYVGIPFCPSKCSYCSFASYEITGGVGKYYREFVNTLEKEIRLTGEELRKNPQKIESVYFGGGTPSTLTEEDLEQILKVFREEIDFRNVKEFTFEAGREDSITRKKLEILKKYGVDRVSLNPQSFQEKTLKKVNRKFNRDHFEEVYRNCKKLGFIINMDFILGLPEESTEDMIDSLEQLKNFDVENITLHSLAFKRASKLAKGSQEREKIDRKRLEETIASLMKEKRLEPYYLYRQKNMLDWGENIGYAKPGTESIFNMEMIEENQNTIALGGGGISKVVVEEENGHDYIERFVNPKDPVLYIREMEKRQEQKFALFEKYREGKHEI
ncbi:MAG TPA: coproporphyrinogen III oxidase [Fusobacterium sp.]|uniref:coproporphyrinogen III oxidase n=1 Tax=Fusobacterium sp. TaxID=68766 RepID=UPI002F4228B9